MMQQVQAVYEDGVFKPLSPPSLAEHELVCITISPLARNDDEWLDHDAHARAEKEGDDAISLDEAQRCLCGIRGSLADTVIDELGEF